MPNNPPTSANDLVRLIKLFTTLQNENRALRDRVEVQQEMIEGLEQEVRECQGIARHVRYVDWQNAKLEYEQD